MRCAAMCLRRRGRARLVDVGVVDVSIAVRVRLPREVRLDHEGNQHARDGQSREEAISGRVDRKLREKLPGRRRPYDVRRRLVEVLRLAQL